MNARERLIGAWELIDGKLLTEGKTTDYEFAPQSGGGGVLIYSANGYMSATLSKRDRPAFATDQLDGGTEEEKVRAYSTFIAYTASFEVNETEMSVTHFVKYASFPNFVGRALTRYLVFSGPEGQSGEELRLNTPPMNFGGRNVDSYLTWRKL